MRRALTLWALMLAAATAAAPASAADPRIPDWRQSHLIEGDSGTIRLYRASACLLVADGEGAHALLATRPGSPDERRLFERLTAEPTSPCPTRIDRLTVPQRRLLLRPLLVRGAIAEAFVRIGTLPPPATPAGPPSADAPAADARAVAFCATSSEPDTVAALLRFNPGSPGERRRLLALTDAFRACLPEGAALAAGRLEMRALLAEALYAARLAGEGAGTR